MVRSRCQSQVGRRKQSRSLSGMGTTLSLSVDRMGSGHMCSTDQRSDLLGAIGRAPSGPHRPSAAVLRPREPIECYRDAYPDGRMEGETR